jgi:hypothetical protein
MEKSKITKTVGEGRSTFLRSWLSRARRPGTYTDQSPSRTFSDWQDRKSPVPAASCDVYPPGETSPGTTERSTPLALVEAGAGVSIAVVRDLSLSERPALPALVEDCHPATTERDTLPASVEDEPLVTIECLTLPAPLEAVTSVTIERNTPPALLEARVFDTVECGTGDLFDDSTVAEPPEDPEKPFGCAVCSQRFKLGIHCCQHMTARHPRMAPCSPKQLPSAAQRNKNPHLKCRWCEKLWLTQRARTQHERSAHKALFYDREVPVTRRQPPWSSSDTKKMVLLEMQMEQDGVSNIED